MQTAAAPTIEQIRSHFPALCGDAVYLENAGGSQVPACVADAVRDYMLTSYVQTGAGYPASRRATSTVEAAREFLGLFMNSIDGRVIIGPSSSQLCKHLADAYAAVLSPGDEIVIGQTGHEANAGPWYRLADRGFTIKTWEVCLDTHTLNIETLGTLLTERTRIVAFPQTSNLLGDIVDVRGAADLAHTVGARVVVDGVAFAPHRAIDVSAWDADWYVYSTYKVFGPHMAAMYAKGDALAELRGPGHFFLPEPARWELGCISHEACAGVLALSGYLAFLAGAQDLGRKEIEEAWRLMAGLEAPVQRRLMDYLLQKEGVRLFGPRTTDESRVGIVSFTSSKTAPRDIVEATDRANIGIRYGHMYAYRLCEALDLDPSSGVVRVSLAHYNTESEIERLANVLEHVL